MDQYAGIPGHSTYCYTELAASFINFCVIACHLLDFVVQGKITGRRTDNASGRHPTGTPSSRHFYVECPFCHNPASLSGLGPGVFADAEPSVSKH